MTSTPTPPARDRVVTRIPLAGLLTKGVRA